MLASTMPLAQAVQHVRESTGYTVLDDFGVIQVSGADASEFLHSQTTNDVKALSSGHGQASALLDRKGHVQAYFSLHQLDNAFLILAERLQIPTVLQRLDAFLFTENVKFQDRTGDFVLLSVQGAKSGSDLQHVGMSVSQATQEYAIWTDTVAEDVPVLGIKRTLTGEEGYVLLLPEEQADTVLKHLESSPDTRHWLSLSPDVMDTLRIEAGIPRFGVDMDDTLMLPQTGLEQYAVSYTKGCYQGQEVIAKLKTYGGIQKALVGLLLEPGSPLPEWNAACMIDDKNVGTVKSAVFSPTLNRPVAMAYLAREYRVPNHSMTLSVDGKPYPATVVLLPFVQSQDASEKARSLYDTALKHFAENREDEAIQLLREAIELDPLLADAYESLGVILSRRDEYDEAIALMQKLAQINPDEVMAHTNLSIFYMKKGMKEEAEVEKALATTLSFKKAMAASQQQKNEAEERQQKLQALEDKVRMFNEVLDLDPDDTLANYGLGNTLLELERYAEAIPRLEKAVAQDPKYTVAYLALGKAYASAGQVEEAKATYTKGIAVASQRGDLMPLKDMEQRLAAL